MFAVRETEYDAFIFYSIYFILADSFLQPETGILYMRLIYLRIFKGKTCTFLRSDLMFHALIVFSSVS